MKNNFLIILLISLCTIHTSAHNRVDVKWSTLPQKMDIDMDKWGDYSAVFLYNRIKSSYTKMNSKEVKHSKIIHRRIRLLNEEAVNSFNTLQIPYTDEYRVQGLKARTIHADGSYTDIDSADYENAQEGDMKLILIAFENLQIGDDIEYYYEWNFPSTIFSTVLMNTGLSTVQDYFEVEVDKGISIDLKGYNGVVVYEDTSLGDGTQILYTEMRDVEEVEEELFSFPLRHAPRLEYSVTLDDASGAPLDWDSYHPYETTLNTKMYLQDRGLKSLIKDIPVAQNTERQIFEIENYLKSSFESSQTEFAMYRDIKSILKSGVMSNNEVAGILAAILQKSQIDFKLGYTTNRTEKEFDSDFVNSNNLQYLFFYFPKLDKYLLPGARDLRFSFLPFPLTENNAILYSTSQKSGHSIHRIPAKDSDQNSHNHTVKVSILPDMQAATISTIESLNGDSKSDALPTFTKYKNKEATDFLKNYVRLDSEDEVAELKVKNAEWTSFLYAKPLIFESEVVSKYILQSVADEEYLLSIGTVIGKQAELPRTSNQRIYDIDMSAPHSLKRNITFDIPEGYKVVNLDDLNMDKTLHRGQRDECYFRSSYTKIGNKLMVEIDERYATSHLPKSDYETFREVINAAAEFNKLELLISKQ